MGLIFVLVILALLTSISLRHIGGNVLELDANIINLTYYFNILIARVDRETLIESYSPNKFMSNICTSAAAYLVV